MSDPQTWTMIGGMFTFMVVIMGVLVRLFGENLDERFGALTAIMTAGLDKVDMRFEQVDRRFDELDRRFEQVDKRFEHVENRLDRIEGHVAELDRDVTVIARRLMGPEAS